jgi:hypothetical protein
MLLNLKWDIEIDSLGQLSRAELRVLWSRSLRASHPGRLDVTFLPLASPMRAGAQLWRAHPTGWPRSLIGCWLACFGTTQPMHPRVREVRCFR